MWDVILSIGHFETIYLAIFKTLLCFEMAIRFMWPFRKDHGHFETANGFKSPSNIIITLSVFQSFAGSVEELFNTISLLRFYSFRPLNDKHAYSAESIHIFYV